MRAVLGAGAVDDRVSLGDVIAKGISEALSTTVVGIGIAIPTLIAHGLLTKKVEKLASDMELLISGLLTKCYNQKGRRGSFEFPSEVQA
jgi:biopolymer transport protein ExbB